VSLNSSSQLRASSSLENDLRGTVVEKNTENILNIILVRGVFATIAFAEMFFAASSPQYL